MNDTLQIKSLDLSTIDAGNLPGSAVDFARVAGGSPTTALRKAVVGNSSIVVRVAHTARTSTQPQRSLFSFEETFSREDAGGNIIREDNAAYKHQVVYPFGVTEYEMVVLAQRSFGALLADNGALLRQFLRLQT